MTGTVAGESGNQTTDTVTDSTAGVFDGETLEIDGGPVGIAIDVATGAEYGAIILREEVTYI